MMKVKTKSSLAKRNIEKFMRNRMAVIGAVILIAILFACILAPLLTPYDPNFIDVSQKNQPCSKTHLLGTDRMGRDLFARILYGGRMSILIGVVSAVGATALGAVLGCISGFYGGIVDKILVYIAEIFQSFPYYLLILLCVGLMGQSTKNLSGLQSISEDYYEAAVIDGANFWDKLFKITLPLLRPSINVTIVLNVIYVFNSFAIVNTITAGAPANQTHTISTYLYYLAFNKNKYGASAALSLVSFVILSIFAVIYMKTQMKEET